MNYVKYSRNMIMLEDQNSDFSAKGGPVKGHLKVETGNNKGAMRVSVHNLKPYPKGDYIYKLIFFGKVEERTIHSVVGNLILNRNGSGESYFRFNPANMDDKGNDYNQFTTAIVAAVSTADDQEPLHPVLKGMTGNQPSLRKPQAARSGNRETRTGRPGVMSEQLAQAASFAQAPGDGSPSFDAPPLPEEEVAAAEARQEEADPALKKEAISQEEMMKIKRDREPKEESQPLDRKRSAVKESEPAPVAKNTYNNFYNEYILHSCNHACRSAEYYEEVTPFENDVTKARWKKIMNVGNMPLVSPGAKHFAAQYHHYLFGAQGDEDGYACRFFFAIPGRNLEGDKPDGGKSGFTHWQPVRGEEGKESGYGYWIAAVDAQTGNIEDVL